MLTKIHGPLNNHNYSDSLVKDNMLWHNTSQLLSGLRICLHPTCIRRLYLRIRTSVEPWLPLKTLETNLPQGVIIELVDCAEVGITSTARTVSKEATSNS